MRSARRISKVEAVISLLLFLVVVPFLWWLLLWAALNLPVSLLWWLLLVGMTLSAIRGFLIAIGQIASAWSEDEEEEQPPVEEEAPEAAEEEQPSATTPTAPAQPREPVCPNCGYHDDGGRTSCPHCGMPLAPP